MDHFVLQMSNMWDFGASLSLYLVSPYSLMFSLWCSVRSLICWNLVSRRLWGLVSGHAAKWGFVFVTAASGGSTTPRLLAKNSWGWNVSMTQNKWIQTLNPCKGQLYTAHFKNRSSVLGSCSVTKSCLTLCNPMDCSALGSSVFHCLLKFAQIHVPWVSSAI